MKKFKLYSEWKQENNTLLSLLYTYMLAAVLIPWGVCVYVCVCVCSFTLVTTDYELDY